MGKDTCVRIEAFREWVRKAVPTQTVLLLELLSIFFEILPWFRVLPWIGMLPGIERLPCVDVPSQLSIPPYVKVISIVCAVGLTLFKYHKYSFCSLSSGCANTPEIARECMQRVYRQENLFRISRCARYIGILTIYFLFRAEVIKNPENFSWGVLSAGAFLLLHVFFGLNRWTFQIWPVALLSTSAMLLYLCFWGQLYDPRNMWGIGFNTVTLIDNIDVAANIVTGGIVTAAILSLIVVFCKDIYGKYKTQSQSNSSKETRRQLLTHWHFQPKAPISNPFVWIVGIFLVLCISFATSYFLSRNLSGSHKESSKLTFEVYLFMVSCALTIAGLSSHLNASDKSLIQSEYFFLLYHAPQLLGTLGCSPINEKYEQRWTDFFQVLSNLYVNSGAIESENREWHKMDYAFTGLFQSLGLCGKTLLYARSLYSFEEARAERCGETDCKTNSSEKNILMSDVEFSKLCSLDKKQQNYFDAGTVLNYIRTLQNSFFSQDTITVWARLLEHSNIAAADFIRVVQMDVLSMAIRLQSDDNRCLCWLCEKDCFFCNKQNADGFCTMKYKGIRCDKKDNEAPILHYKRLFLLKYPFMVFMCAKRRLPNAFTWDDLSSSHKESRVSIFETQLRSYYNKLIHNKDLNLRTVICEDDEKAFNKGLKAIKIVKEEFIEYLRSPGAFLDSSWLEEYNKNIQDALQNYDDPCVHDMLPEIEENLKHFNKVNRMFRHSTEDNVKIGIEDYLFFEVKENSHEEKP